MNSIIRVSLGLGVNPADAIDKTFVVHSPPPRRDVAKFEVISIERDHDHRGYCLFEVNVVEVMDESFIGNPILFNFNGRYFNTKTTRDSLYETPQYSISDLSHSSGLENELTRALREEMTIEIDAGIIARLRQQTERIYS